MGRSRAWMNKRGYLSTLSTVAKGSAPLPDSKKNKEKNNASHHFRRNTMHTAAGQRVRVDHNGNQAVGSGRSVKLQQTNKMHSREQERFLVFHGTWISERGKERSGTNDSMQRRQGIHYSQSHAEQEQYGLGKCDFWGCYRRRMGRSYRRSLGVPRDSDASQEYVRQFQYSQVNQ